MRKFNPLAAYGTITPPDRGAVYYQDGAAFNSSGEVVYEDQPATPPKKVVSEVTTVDAVTHETVTETVVTEVEDIEPGDPKTILTAWLKGETRLHHAVARKLVKDAYAVILATKDEMVDYLVNTANLVPAELVKVD